MCFFFFFFFQAEDGIRDLTVTGVQTCALPIFSGGVAAEETRILQENVQGGTAVRSAIGCPTAAKTGTTSELVDAWLDGYTPRYSTAVWMGYPNRRVSMTDVHGETQQGGRLPAAIWHAYMGAVTEGHPCAAL